jgi:hypothetical protein
LVISVQVRSPPRARGWYPAVVNTHCSVAATMEAILRVFSEDRRALPQAALLGGKSSRYRLPYRWNCQFRARRGFAGFLGIAPQETLSASMSDRKSRRTADFERFSEMA